MSTTSRRADAERGPKISVRTLANKHRQHEPIVMVTAYDFPMARAADEADVDSILVGDSLAMVVLGHEDTLSVTMDEMLHHARAVSRGADRPLLVGDMPFMSYQADVAEAVRNAGRFLKEAGMNAVKLEGGRSVAPTAGVIVRAGIPVLGHVGLTPQSVNALGGWKVQGRTASAAQRLLDDALALEDAGCFGVVIEGVPERVAEQVTLRLKIPTIGIGAGRGVSGQVLVAHDLLGMFHGKAPRFAKAYAAVGETMVAAFRCFRDEIRAGRFPGQEHTYEMTDAEWEAFAPLEAVRPASEAKA